MGLFSSKKTIKVASTVYNMAGPEEDRSNYLKSSVFSAVMSRVPNTYLGETIVTNYLTGPGIKQRQFHSWAKRNSYAGLPDVSIKRTLAVDPQVVKPYIPVPASPAGLVTEVQTASLGDGDYSVFAEQWILENNPTDINTDYIAEYFDDDHTITIQYEGGATDTFGAGIYDKDKQFIAVNYYHQIPTSVQSLIVGTLVEDEPASPDITGFTAGAVVNTGLVNHTLNYQKTVTKTYSDATPQVGPTVTNESDVVPFNGTESVFSKNEYEGGSGGPETSSVETTLYVWELRHVVDRVSTTVETNDLGGGVTETVTTEIDGDHLDPIFDHRTDTQETVNGEIVGGDKLWIYEIGSGIVALDDLSEKVTVSGTEEFFPFIPVRLNNKSITHSDYDSDNGGSGLFQDSITAYRKATAGLQKLTQLIDQVEDNDDLNEIDYAYIVYGASLNSNEDACKKYMYQFFRDLISFQTTSSTYMDDFKAGVANYDILEADYQGWATGQTNILSPFYNTLSPAVPSLVKPKTTTLKLHTANTQTDDYDVRISWVSINEDFFTGLGKPDAVKGDIWFEKAGGYSWTQFKGASLLDARLSEDNTIEETHMFWQTGENTYKRLTMHGLIHQNFIYKGKSVDITASEALDDEDTSGFIIPLHDPTVRAMGLVDATQMATANTFIVFNSYKVYKKKWYQTFFGMLLIIVAIVVVAVLINPSAIGGLSGALGTNAAVGASLGLTGSAAIIAGAAANALAAIVISSAIGTVSTKLFGEKWGSLIAAIATFALSMGMSGGFTNMSLSTTLSPQNILAFSSSLANGYAGMAQAQIMGIQSDMINNTAEYEDQMEEINDMIRDMGGSNDLYFDPMQLTDVNAGNGLGTSGSYLPESLDEFIHRTTMTGSDIVDITLSLVENYADLNLELPLN